jgi:hypothetical protein
MIGIHYPKAILCVKGDPICQYRLDQKVEYLD